MKSVTYIVNGKKHNVIVEAHEMLSSVIREKIGLTGTKIGCSQGSCGACTVLVNGSPVLSCITPAMRYEGATITTIEGLSKNGELHKLQEKFVSKGAIQCGFCTPGMVLTAYDFIKKTPNPSIDEIKMALSGNVCRCTGYKKIIEAVAEYANESGEAGVQVLKHHLSNPEGEDELRKIIGVSRPLIEASKKVQGTADYADDIQLKDALHVKFVRSTYLSLIHI